MYQINPILAIDSYKLGHCTMYPEGTTKVYSNFTPRSFTHIKGSFPKGFFNNKAVVFGISGAFQEINEAFTDNFFSRDKEVVLKEFTDSILPFIGDNSPKDIVDKIEALHELGYLPLRVKSLPEGTQINANIPMMTVTNTHPDFAWLPNYLETFISSQIWKMSTTATIAKVYKNIFDYYAKKTGTPPEFTLFQGHDFSSRGMSGFADSARSGIGHLTSFMGTDSVSSVDYAKKYYKADWFIGGSVPASEHSVMTMGLEIGEIDTFRRIFKKFPKGVVSIVSDSYDYWNTITEMAKELKPEIMAREKDSLGLCKTVFRPDSSDPVKVIIGAVNPSEVDAVSLEEFKEIVVDILHDTLSDETPHGEHGGDITGFFRWNKETYEVTYSPDWNRHDKQYYFIDNYGGKSSKLSINKIELSPEQKGSVECLYETFGGTKTSTGHIQLDEHVGLIYGDSITPMRAFDILKGLDEKGFSSGNVVLGLGSFTYQMLTRDSLGFAMKATYAEINGKGIQIFKQPKTDSGKNSAKGMLRVDKIDGEYVLIDCLDCDDGGELQVIFENGLFQNLPTLQEVRERLSNV